MARGFQPLGCFEPSVYSYGYGEAVEGEVPAPASAAGSPFDQIGQYVDTEQAAGALRAFFFGEESREKEATLRADIQKWRYNAQQGTFPGKNFWLSKAQKAEAELAAVSEKALESRTLAQAQQAAQVGIAAMAVLGVGVVGLVVWSQYTRAQIAREELKRLRGE